MKKNRLFQKNFYNFYAPKLDSKAQTDFEKLLKLINHSEL
jgi:hypothetical protein